MAATKGRGFRVQGSGFRVQDIDANGSSES
jgi:hypothetical protein